MYLVRWIHSLPSSLPSITDPPKCVGMEGSGQIQQSFLNVVDCKVVVKEKEFASSYSSDGSA